MRPTEPVPVKAQRIEEVLDRYREEIPPPIFRKLNTQVEDVVRTAEAETQVAAGRAGLLGAIATAGVSAVAFEHEFSRNLESLARSAKQLSKAVRNEEFDQIDELATGMLAAVNEARQMRQIFSPMFSEEDRTRKIKPRAEPLISGVFEALGPFTADVSTGFEGLSEVRLPPGTQAEWSALWQNLAINAVNAMADRPERKILVRHEREGRTDQIFLEDTGAGVDLETADQLFEPFRRASEAPAGDAGMGFGGTGLGLTIVRMLSETLQCRVEFVAPMPDFSSAARVAWRER